MRRCRHRTAQVFDFRLKDADDFGNDFIETYDYRWFFDSSTPDQLVFDAGVEVSIRYQALREFILLTAQLNGETIGTVRFGEAETVPIGLVDLILAELQDDLVFL
ncbi:hypothetical protein [Rhodopirellula bahusiensis]|uniref:hypothetical protein n=1 Tax=Rhodopirellula bahusiensis TaxID=2014065 RepID=UPI003267DC66